MGINLPNPKKESINSIDIELPNQPNPNSGSNVVIPPPLNGIAAFNIFNQLANSVLASQIILKNELNQESAAQLGGFSEVVNQEVSRINQFKINQPDAIPDGLGGYSASSSGFWTKRLSQVTGLPVMTAITFVGTTYTSTSGNQITIPTITFEMVLIKINKGRNIEKTDITGRDTGSVKEYISAKDFIVEINAIVTASQNVSDGMSLYYQTGKYPEENMEQIDFLLNAPIAIEVICPYLNRRGINYLVIDDGVQINQIEGEYEAQRLTIPCLSDNPLILQVNS